MWHQCAYLAFKPFGVPMSGLVVAFRHFFSTLPLSFIFGTERLPTLKVNSGPLWSLSWKKVSFRQTQLGFAFCFVYHFTFNTFFHLFFSPTFIGTIPGGS